MRLRKMMAVLMVTVLAVTSLSGCGNTGKRKTIGTVTPEAGSGGQGQTTPSITLVVASNQTAADNPYHYGLETFKEVLEELSNGTIQVTCSDGTLSEDETELVKMLDSGKAQMIVCSPGHMTSAGASEVDMLSLLYLFDGFSHWESAMDGEFGDTMADIILKQTGNKYRVMGYWSAGVRDYYGKKPITTAADVSGLTIRTQTSSVVTEFWSTLGATPVNIGWGELYNALKNNEVDSSENDYTNLMLKLHHTTENGKYICETHHDFTTRLFIMNGSIYDSLTTEQKNWIETASLAATLKERAVTYDMMDQSKEKCIADGAVVTPYQQMDIASFRSVAIDIQDRYAQEHGLTTYLNMIRGAQ